MSDTPEKTETASLKFIIPVIVVVLLIAGAGIFITQTGVDKELVKGAVDHWIVSMEKNAKDKGMELSITYDDVVMEGGASNRHAIITKPKVSWNVPASAEQAESMASLMLENISLHPTSADLSSLRVEVPSPFSIYEKEEKTGEVSFASPLHVLGEKINKDGKNYISSQVNVPTALTLTDLKSNESLVLESAEGGVASTTFLEEDSRMGRFNLNLSDVSLHEKEGEEALLNTAKLMLDVSNELVDANNSDVTVKMGLDSLTANEEVLPYGPISASIDAHYVGPMPEDEKPIDWMQSKILFTLNQFSLTSNLGGVDATADIKSAEGDALPIGKLDLTITNLKNIYDELRKNEILAEEDGQLIGAFLQKAVDSNMDAEKIQIPLTREAQGNLKIGKMSFEEAVALVLTSGAGAGAIAPTPPTAPIEESAPQTATETPAAPEAAPKE